MSSDAPLGWEPSQRSGLQRTLKMGSLLLSKFLTRRRFRGTDWLNRNNVDNEFSSLDVAVSAWDHRKMKLQLRNDFISTYLHAIEIYPRGDLPVEVILPTQYVLLVPCAVSICKLCANWIQCLQFVHFGICFPDFLSALLDLHVLSCSLINFTIHFTSNHLVPEQIMNARTIHSENIKYLLKYKWLAAFVLNWLVHATQ